ncbi:MAG: TrmB family transcriptional regulator [Candidatus Woesearchaeota archaeon]
MGKDIIEALERIGFTNNEAKTYKALLQTGTTKAGNLATKTNLDRSSTYDALRKLTERGVISFVIKENTKHYQVNNPEDLFSFIKEKETIIQNILPEIKKIHNKKTEESEILVFKGYKGIKSAFEDKIREKQTIRVFDSEGQFSERMTWYSERFKKEVEKNKIEIKHLARKGVKIKGSKTTTVKHVDKKYTEKSQGVIDIYSDKVCIMLWSETPEAVVIKNKGLAESFKDYFDMIWEK